MREVIRQAALSIRLICKIWNLIGRISEAETRFFLASPRMKSSILSLTKVYYANDINIS